MPLIVDTYNVLHVVGILPPDLAGIEVPGLVRLIRASRFRRQKTVLVCDGVKTPGSPSGKFGPISIRYAGAHRQADDLIAAMVRQSTDPRRLTVVSSDRRVMRQAARRRCKTLSSHDFLRRLAEDATLPRRPGRDRDRPEERSKTGAGGPLSQEQIDRWASIFDLDPESPTPIEVEPSEEEIRQAIERVEPEHPPDPDQGRTASDQFEPEALIEESKPESNLPEREQAAEAPRPRSPILPGSLIREAAEMAAAFEQNPEPDQKDEVEEGDKAEIDEDREQTGPGEPAWGEMLIEDAADVSPTGEGGSSILPPEIIRQAEQMLEDLESSASMPDEVDDDDPSRQ